MKRTKRVFTELHKARIKENHAHYWKGKVGPRLGKKLTEEQRKRVSEAHLGQKPWNKGRRLTEEEKEATKNGRPFKIGHIPWNKGKKMSESVRKKVSEASSRFWKYYENEVKKELEKDGWRVIDRGWPDFVCIKGDQIRFVEAKGPDAYLKPAQKLMHQILAGLGIIVEVIKSKPREEPNEEERPDNGQRVAEGL